MDRSTPRNPKNETGSRTDPSLEASLLVAAFARLDPVALSVALGAVTGCALSGATAVLLIRSQLPEAEGVVGPHLGLLSNYLPGYSVTWRGVALGGVWGTLVGAVGGLALALMVNLSHRVYARVRLRRSRAGEISDAL